MIGKMWRHESRRSEPRWGFNPSMPRFCDTGYSIILPPHDARDTKTLLASKKFNCIDERILTHFLLNQEEMSRTRKITLMQCTQPTLSFCSLEWEALGRNLCRSTITDGLRLAVAVPDHMEKPIVVCHNMYGIDRLVMVIYAQNKRALVLRSVGRNTVIENEGLTKYHFAFFRPE